MASDGAFSMRKKHAYLIIFQKIVYVCIFVKMLSRLSPLYNAPVSMVERNKSV